MFATPRRVTRSMARSCSSFVIPCLLAVPDARPSLLGRFASLQWQRECGSIWQSPLASFAPESQHQDFPEEGGTWLRAASNISCCCRAEATSRGERRGRLWFKRGAIFRIFHFIKAAGVPLTQVVDGDVVSDRHQPGHELIAAVVTGAPSPARAATSPEQVFRGGGSCRSNAAGSAAADAHTADQSVEQIRIAAPQSTRDLGLFGFHRNQRTEGSGDHTNGIYEAAGEKTQGMPLRFIKFSGTMPTTCTSGRRNLLPGMSDSPRAGS